MAGDTTQLAIDRTRLAHERTLMAWVRTAASLISFGFAIDKFFERVPDPEPRSWLNAHHFSLAMIWIAIVSLALATWQHNRNFNELRRDFGKQPFSPALIMAALVAGLGILGLLAILTQG
jgi:putative membrane protein